MFPLLRFKVNVSCLLCSSNCKIRVSDIGFSVLRIYSWRNDEESYLGFVVKDLSSEAGSSRDGAGPRAED
ncbi:hypothetical protein LINGRAHAP2_LOCUS30811 [Linum grandiflorum]